MQLDPAWNFEKYGCYEEDRFEQSRAEHAEALATGLIADPKSAPHGGFRIALTWPEEVTGPACELSRDLASLLPGTPPYPYDSIHSSVGNRRCDEDRLVDPGAHPADRKFLDDLCDAALTAVNEARGDRQRRMTRFSPALLAPRMAMVFGRPGPGYWALHQAVHAALAAADLELEGSWGPHLTLTRFGEPAGKDAALQAARLLKRWEPVTATPSGVLVGWYTVANGSFSVTAYRTFSLP